MLCSALLVMMQHTIGGAAPFEADVVSRRFFVGSIAAASITVFAVEALARFAGTCLRRMRGEA